MLVLFLSAAKIAIRSVIALSTLAGTAQMGRMSCDLSTSTNHSHLATQGLSSPVRARPSLCQGSLTQWSRGGSENFVETPTTKTEVPDSMRVVGDTMTAGCL